VDLQSDVVKTGAPERGDPLEKRLQMTLTVRNSLVAFLPLGLLAAASFGHAQVQPGQVSPPAFIFPDRAKPAEVVLSGADIGFRVERTVGDKVVGRFVVRVDGKWREVAASYEAKPLTAR
jgi:hypothetical protein